MSSMRKNTLLVLSCLLFLELLAGVEWGIHRGLSSLFAKQVLLITSFTQIGYIVSAFGISKAVTNLLFGAVSDRVGRKPVVILGMIFTGLGGALIASTFNFTNMLIGTALIGVGGGATFVGIMVSMTETLPLQIGLAMGLFELAAYGGSSIGTYLGGYFAGVHGLRYPFYAFVAISASGAVLSYLLMPETSEPEGRLREPGIIPREHLPDFIRTLPLCLAGFSSKIMDSLVISFLPLYLLERQVSLEQATVILSTFTLSWAILQPVTGHLSDRVGRKNIASLGLASSAVTILAFTFTSNYFFLVFLALVLGFEAALFYTPLVAMVSDIAPSEVEGTFIGGYRFFRDMGYFFGPILLGVIADFYDLNYSIYLTSVIILLAVVVLYFRLDETKPHTLITK